MLGAIGSSRDAAWCNSTINKLSTPLCDARRVGDGVVLANRADGPPTREEVPVENRDSGRRVTLTW